MVGVALYKYWKKSRDPIFFGKSSSADCGQSNPWSTIMISIYKTFELGWKTTSCKSGFKPSLLRTGRVCLCWYCLTLIIRGWTVGIGLFRVYYDYSPTIVFTLYGGEMPYTILKKRRYLLYCFALVTRILEEIHVPMMRTSCLLRPEIREIQRNRKYKDGVAFFWIACFCRTLLSVAIFCLFYP